MKTKKINVLVLGAQGMLGRVVYNYLGANSEIQCFGTARSKTDKLLGFDANLTPNSWQRLVKKTSFDYVVNTIALLKNYPTGKTPRKKDYLKINSKFPLFLEKRSVTDKFKLIHFSTDAVFPKNQAASDEGSTPNPEDIYGKSKHLGEVTGLNSLTIRISIIGYSPRKKEGLLEWVINSQNKINGYTNHTWSGATVLQLAKLIEWLITKGGFSKAKKQTSILHYAPLGPVNKYELVKAIIDTNHKSLKLFKVKNKEKISRYLDSNYKNLLPKSLVNNNIVQTLKDLREFEKQIKKYD